MKFFEFRIGSVFWRLQNYGLSAFLEYLFLYKYQLRRTYVPANSDYESFVQILNKRYSSDLTVDRAKQDIQNIIDSFISAQEEMSFPQMKKVVETGHLSLRLLVIYAVVYSSKSEFFLETGTQHGISSYVALASMKNSSPKKNDFNITTLDILDLPKPLSAPEVEYIVAKRQIRKILTSISSQDYSTSLIFFHDSDHSRENMKFELSYAWDTFKAQILIADDIESNDAFLRFCRKRNLEPLVLDNKTEPKVGIVFRE
jgi:hypothetical protein